MKGWYTAREIAELALPGMPQSKRAVNRLIDGECWRDRTSVKGQPLARQRIGREGGGGIEYHVSLLPADARAALSAQHTKIDTNAPQPAVIVQTQAPATPERVLRRDARLAVLSLADAHLKQNPSFGRVAADADFADRYVRGEIAVDPWLREELGGLSLSSLRRWRKERDAGRWHAVGGEGRKITSVLAETEDGDVATYIGGLLVHQPFLTSYHVRDLVEARFGSALRLGVDSVELPSPRTFQRFIVEWRERNAVHLQKLTNPDKFKSHSRIAGGNAYAGVTRVNELWETDASPADVLLKEGRHAIYAIVDVFSRRMMVLVTRTPRTEATMLLLRKAIIAWGVPETLRTDNGSDFTSHAFKRGLHALGIVHDITAAFSPEQKGIVERSIGTLQRDLMRTLPGFIGHDVADRKQIEGRKAFAARLGESDDNAFCVDLTHDELQDYADRWASDKYAHREHKGIGTTPFLRAQHCLTPLRMISNLRALDLLLSPVSGGWRQVTKRGIQLDGGYYISGALLPGRRVFCRQDPEDMGKLLVFEDEHGAFICAATCPERAGVDPRQAVAMARHEQSRIIKEETARIRAEAKKIRPRDMADAILDLAASKAPNVMAFPKRQSEHTTGALENAADAIAATDQTSFEVPLNPLQQPIQAAAANGNVHQLPETAHQRFKRALGMQKKLKAGVEIDADDARWLGGYEQTAEYQSLARMLRDFGDGEWLEA